jgi:RimJ/RimL family protein N-acetyltransferase
LAEPVKLRSLRGRDRDAACALLERRSRENLYLLDLVAQQGGAPQPGEPRAECLGAWRGEVLASVLSLRPSIALAADADAAVVAALVPYADLPGGGLVKSDVRAVARLWSGLAARGRRALLDRLETAHALEPGGAARVDPPPGARVRAARVADLDLLVEAARASLVEEHRPDPFEGDPEGFLRWVKGRIPRALVVESRGRAAFVGYADVRRREGFLLQGVYTWPEFRRRGLAAAGVSALCALAFAAGAGHVQLAVVDGNLPAERLYQRLGFKPFARLRTILFG